MTRQLILLDEADGAILPRQLAYARAVEDAERYLRNRAAPNTIRAYKVQFEHWKRYALEREIPILPISPAELIVYLGMRRREGSAPNSVRLALAALAVIDRTSRVTPEHRNPTSLYTDPLVEAWLDGFSREHAKAPEKQAPAITPRELESVLLAAAERPPGASRAQHIAHYARDRAMILMGIAGALRISELVALNLEDVIQAERGLRVNVRRTKVDKHGEGALRGVMPCGRVLRCPVDAWRAWLAVRGASEGPAFVAIGRDGVLTSDRLVDSSARRVVARRAARVGLSLVTSHSMRATFATLAAEKGKPLHKIAEQGGWRSMETLRGYIRQGELFDNNPSSGLLDD
jgi:integrase